MTERVLVAPDSFKGTYSATAVAVAIGQGLALAGLCSDLCPVADGGEGTLEVLLAARGGERRSAWVRDPRGQAIEVEFGLIDGGSTAVVEIAAAIGLDLVPMPERDPERVSSYGAGELIVAAAHAEARRILVACGGSGTSDGGIGALQAIESGGGIGETELICLCDVMTPYEDAARIFGPQKGADPAAVVRLTARLLEASGMLPHSPLGRPMTGCAGGLTGALWAAHGAQLRAGACELLSTVGFDGRLADALAVVVGEGRIDAQTLEGKIAGEVALRTRRRGIPCFAVVGIDSLDDAASTELGLEAVLEAGDLEAIVAAAERIGRSVGSAARSDRRERRLTV